jgi:hypothetical protein
MTTLSESDAMNAHSLLSRNLDVYYTLIRIIYLSFFMSVQVTGIIGIPRTRVGTIGAI